METKTRKTTMIGAALAVAIIALAGAGYAAVTQYTATTTNSNNSMGATYMTMTQDGTGEYTNSSFLTDLYFDSVTVSDNVINYTPVYTHNSTFGTDGDKTYALISVEDFVLNVAQTGTPVSTATLEITAKTGFTPTTGLDYTMVVMSNAGTAGAWITKSTADVSGEDKTWTFTGDKAVSLKTDGATTLKVMLFVSLTAGTVSLDAEHAVSGFEGANSTIQGKTTFEFKLTATPATPASP